MLIVLFGGSNPLLEPHPLVVEPILRRALLEDIGNGNDLTTDAILSPTLQTQARIVAREAGIAAGIKLACGAFALLGDDIDLDVHFLDGQHFEQGATLATIRGDARAILTGERTVLNILSRLCGIATQTRSLVDAIATTNSHVVCTRKTTPGLRVLEKYAVRCGGGSNHRFGLDDAVLIKDNHIALAGSIHEAISRVRMNVGHMVKIEVEVDSLTQLQELLKEHVDAVLLDNMDEPSLREAVRAVNGHMLTEASGGITATRILAVAQTGVNLISVGRLTQGCAIIDIGLDI